MKCEKCGTLVSESELFCPECGNKIKHQNIRMNNNGQGAQNNYANQHPQSQQYYQVNQNGQYNDAQVPPVYYDGYKKKNNSNKALICILIALMIVLISVMSVFTYFAYNSKKAEEIEDTLTESEAPDEETDVPADETPEVELVTESPEPTATEEEIPSESRYSVVKKNVTWEEASADAAKKGGMLVSINDADEFKTVCRLAMDNDIVMFWAGARITDQASWDYVRWQDGTYMEYTRWAEGEPSVYDLSSENMEYEDCLMIFKPDGIWYFNDAPNDGNRYYKKAGYIIEYGD